MKSRDARAPRQGWIRTAILLSCLTACASGRQDHYPEEWAAEEAVNSAPEPQKRREPTLPELANGHRTPNQCVTAARWLIEPDPKRALAYLEACADREDFDILQPLLRSPWLGFVAKSGARGYRVLLRSIAVRKDFEADFGSVHVSGLPVNRMSIEKAQARRLTPVFGAQSVGVVTDVEELAREELKYHLSPGRWKETTYKKYADGRKVTIGERYFTVKKPSDDLPASYVPTGKILRFATPPDCPGSDSTSKLYFVQIGRRLQGGGEDKDVFAAKLVACHGIGP